MLKRAGKFILAAMLLFLISGCSAGKPDVSKDIPIKVQDNLVKTQDSLPIKIINPEGKNIEQRFITPEGFQRIEPDKNSFGEYLRTLPLKPHGASVKYFSGGEKPNYGVYAAVVDMEIGDRDLQQCADAVMRLRGEYLYKQGRFNEISFHFADGTLVPYSKWMEGYRIVMNNDKPSWVKKYDYSNSYESFRRYMDIVFAYANTVSLEKELKPVDNASMEIGDVFIKGAYPGHCVIVVDMAVKKSNGEKLFLLAQSYMPAQDIQILENPNNKSISPWYELKDLQELRTPEWSFKNNSLRRFP